MQLDSRNILPLGEATYCILPWIGTVGYRTLERCLRRLGGDSPTIGIIDGDTPYFLTVQLAKHDREDLRRQLISLIEQGLSNEDLIGPGEAPQLQKYDEFVPSKLLRKAFVADSLDIAELRTVLNGWL